jgi:hypothetical protein
LKVTYWHQLTLLLAVSYELAVSNVCFNGKFSEVTDV